MGASVAIDLYHTPPKWPCCPPPPTKVQVVVEYTSLLARWYKLEQMLNTVMTEAHSLSVCGESWFIVGALIVHDTGVQPHPAPESNQSDLGQVRL